jgi:hypothetical protein
VRRAARILPVCAILLVAISGCGPGAGSSTGRFAPYVDVTLAPSQLDEVVHRSGARAVSLAFVLAGRGCTASWDGRLSIGDPSVRAATRGIASVVSFGGRDGPELAQRCSTTAALATQYERAVDEVGAIRADFDLEPGTLGNSAQLARRSRAMALLQTHEQAAGKRIGISLTLPADRNGLTQEALDAIRSALRAGVRVQIVNLLAMDYGASAAAGRMARYAIETATSSERQLRGLLPNLPARALWAHIGITTMIGRNDTKSETFTTADAAAVLRFARAHGVGALSFWSLGRDRSCPSGSLAQPASDSCSGVAQRPFQFSRVFATYAG